MKDLNFFDSYIETKEFKIDKKFILYTFIAVLCFGTIIYGVGNQIKISRLKSYVVQLKNTAESPDIVQRVEEIKEQEEEISQFKTEVDKIRDLNESIERENTVDDNLLKMISYSMPESIFLNTINIAQDEIHIAGVSKDKWSIAEFSKGMEYIENVDKVFISNINQEEENYKFDLNITFKGGVENGED